MKRVEFLYLSQENCVEAGGYDMGGTLRAVERFFFLHGKKDFIQPGKPVIRWGGPETEETLGRIMSMPSFLGGLQYTDDLKKLGLLGPVNTSGIKFIPSRPHNPQKYGLPRANALITIVDSDTSMPVCVMDGILVSAMSTGAASGIAAKYLAKSNSEVLGLIGGSVQGITQLLGIKNAVPSISTVKIFDINKETSKKFVKRMKQEIDMDFNIVNSTQEAIEFSDIVCTATMAQEPYIDSSWYKEGILHCEISFWDTPVDTLSYFDFIVVDDWDQVKHHGVDVSWRAVRDGVISEEKIRGNLGEIVVGNKQGRQNSHENIFFNPIGMGIHDLSEAYRVYQNAKDLNIGTVLPLWDNPIL